MAVVTQTDWISIQEAMRRAAIGKKALLQLIKDGRITVRRISTSWPRVRADEIDALIAESTRPAGRRAGT